MGIDCFFYGYFMGIFVEVDINRMRNIDFIDFFTKYMYNNIHKFTIYKTQQPSIFPS